jgi:hypothetical protein
MGLDFNGTRFLLWLKKRGVDFSTTATIGRQSLAVTKKELKNNFDYFGQNVEESALAPFFAESPPFAEAFLNFLGARQIDSVDNSAYEGATVVHDMNQPIPEEYKRKYSLVIDGGCLEHIFNFPTAMKNCMEMVAVGGHLATINPCNNYVGHGFYQFSPELYFRTLARANGFKVEAAFMVEDRQNPIWWLVRDPEEVRCRVTVINETPTLLFVLARKIEEITPFESYPQQSDYMALWKGQEAPKETLSTRQRLTRRWLGRRRHQIVAMMPPLLRDMLISRYDRRFFKAVDLRSQT